MYQCELLPHDTYVHQEAQALNYLNLQMLAAAAARLGRISDRS